MPKAQGSIRLTPDAWAIAREIARRMAELQGQASIGQAVEVALREKARRDGITIGAAHDNQPKPRA